MAWNGSEASCEKTAKKPTCATAPSWKRGTLAGALVVAIGVGAFVILRPGTPKSDGQPAPVPRQSAVIQTVEPAFVSQPEPEEDPQTRRRREFREKLKKMTPEQRADFLFEEMKRKPIDLAPTSNQVFRTGTEQVLSWIFTSKLGDMPPPLPRLPKSDEAHMAEILIYSTPILEGDSEKVKYAKEMVNLAKEEMRKYIKEGGSVGDFIEYYHDKLRQAHDEWHNSQKSVMQVLREDPTIARDYIKEVNARLEAKGIKPVPVSEKMLLHFGADPISE